jgi:biotin-dependent carboxylase-like uncharacterized protein
MPEAPALIVLRAGLHTTVQDGGRWGYQHLGVPVGGALDADALARANLLVGNARDDAALEVTLTGCTLGATGRVQVAVTGAPFQLRRGAEPVPMNRVVDLAAGDTLDLRDRTGGARAYVAVRGGLDVPSVLGSRSAWPLLPRRGALQDGVVIAVGTRSVRPCSERAMPGPVYRSVLRVMASPEVADRPDVVETLCGGTYRVAASANRMAYPLEGPAIPLVAAARPSSATVAGALQVLPSGLPILLMAERQTTGGYPIAAVVITADLPHAAQLPPGGDVRFAPCTRVDALQALWLAAARRGVD